MKQISPHPMISMTPHDLLVQRSKKRKELRRYCHFHPDIIASRSVYIEANGERVTLWFCEECHEGFCDLMRKTYGSVKITGHGTTRAIPQPLEELSEDEKQKAKT